MTEEITPQKLNYFPFFASSWGKKSSTIKFSFLEFQNFGMTKSEYFALIEYK